MQRHRLLAGYRIVLFAVFPIALCIWVWQTYSFTLMYLVRTVSGIPVRLGDLKIDIDSHWIVYEVTDKPTPAVGLTKVHPFARDEYQTKLAIGLADRSGAEYFADNTVPIFRFEWGVVTPRTDRVNKTSAGQEFIGYVVNENIYLAIITEDASVLRDIRSITRLPH